MKTIKNDLKPIYKASLEALSEFDEKWGKKYPIITKSWMDNWTELATFFKYPAELRRIIYTTNVIEGFHRQLRKPKKSKSIFPSDESLLKMLYLITIDVTKKWTMKVQNWGQILSQLSSFLKIAWLIIIKWKRTYTKLFTDPTQILRISQKNLQ